MPTEIQTTNTPSNFHQERQALIDGYVRALAARESAALALREAILALVKMGARLAELVRHAVAVGYNERKTRRPLSDILCGTGIRRRRRGGGRKTDPLALSLLEELIARHGFERARRLARVLGRAADARAVELRRQERQPHQLTSRPMAA